MVNRTLDPDGGRVAYGLEKIYTGPEVEAFKTVFIARHLIAAEVERLLALLDELSGDDDLELNVANAYDDPRLEDAEGVHVPVFYGGSYFADEDAEPSFGGPTYCDEVEGDPAESGIADLDGLFEQAGRLPDGQIIQEAAEART
jgi:hypothetical protein